MLKLLFPGPSARRAREAKRLREELETLDKLRAHCNAREPQIINRLKQIGERDLSELPARAARGGW